MWKGGKVMKVRFRAEAFWLDGKRMVEVYDHKTGRTLLFTCKQYHRIVKYLSHHGGVIYGEKEAK